MSKRERVAHGISGRLRRYADDEYPGMALTKREIRAICIERGRRIQQTEQSALAILTEIAEEQTLEKKPSPLKGVPRPYSLINKDGTPRKPRGKNKKNRFVPIIEVPAAMPPVDSHFAEVNEKPRTMTISEFFPEIEEFEKPKMIPNAYERIKDDVEILRATGRFTVSRIDTIEKNIKDMQFVAANNAKAYAEMSARIAALESRPVVAKPAENAEDHTQLLKVIYDKCVSLIAHQYSSTEMRQFCMHMAALIEKRAGSVTV